MWIGKTDDSPCEAWMNLGKYKITKLLNDCDLMIQNYGLLKQSLDFRN